MNWANSVVIFDEAHNLESIASDAASAEMTSHDIALAIDEVAFLYLPPLLAATWVLFSP